MDIDKTIEHNITDNILLSLQSLTKSKQENDSTTVHMVTQFETNIKHS